MMKKIIILCLVLTMLLPMYGCSQSNNLTISNSSNMVNNSNAAEPFDFEKFEKELIDNKKEVEYNVDEIYTYFPYYYIKEANAPYSSLYQGISDYDPNNILESVTYVRYVYKDGNWVLAENVKNSPFFQQTGKGYVSKTKSNLYYIPIYELEIGRNKIIVTETNNVGKERTIEFFITRLEGEFDDFFFAKNLNNSEEFVFETYQETINVSSDEMSSVALTGYISTPYEIESITWKRYELDNENGWVYKETWNNRFFEPNGIATIFGNHWVIDILYIDLYNKPNLKIEIVAKDTAGNVVTKTVYINMLLQETDVFDSLALYTIDEDAIVLDEEIGLEFISNRLIISFNNNVSSQRCEDIINEIGGQIICVMPIIDYYVVQINQRFNTIADIEKYGEILTNVYEEIMETESDIVFPESMPWLNDL